MSVYEHNWRNLNRHWQEEQRKMSGTIWCDIDDPETNAPHQIGHAFTDKDLNRQHFERTGTENVVTGNSYGRPTYQERQIVTSEMDICGYHWAKQNPFQAQKTPAAIEPEPNEEYLKGYREGILKGEAI